MKLIFPDEVKPYIELQTNSMFELYCKDPVLDLMYTHVENIIPVNVLDLGAGVGRASINLFKKFNWVDTKFYLLDGDSGEKQIGGLNPGSSKDFYNSMEAAKRYCEANGLMNYKLINIEKDSIPDIQFDLVYSLAAIGFHWHLNLYLEKLLRYTSSGALLLFHVRNRKRWIKELKLYVHSLNGYEIIAIDRDVNHKTLAVMVLRRK